MAANSAKKPSQILRQIEILQGQYARAKQRSSSVISKVRKLVADYDLSVEDVFPGHGAAPVSAAPHTADQPAPITAASFAPSAGKIAPKYAHGALTWTGRGSQPRWLREAIEGGAALDDFLVAKSGVATKRPASKTARKASKPTKPAVKAKAKPASKPAVAKKAAKKAPAPKAAAKKAGKGGARKSAAAPAAPADQS